MTRPAAEAYGIPAQRAGFEEWMMAEQSRVFRLCVRLLGDRDEADTAAQEVFLKAHRAFGEAGATELAEPAAWLTRVAVNTCLDRLRSRRWKFWQRRGLGESEERALALAADSQPGPEQRLLAREIHSRLTEALRGLSERQRSVFVLRHYEGRTLEEIAGVLGLEVGTVKAHLGRALRNLRKELRDLYFAREAAK